MFFGILFGSNKVLNFPRFMGNEVLLIAMQLLFYLFYLIKSVIF